MIYNPAVPAAILLTIILFLAGAKWGRGISGAFAMAIIMAGLIPAALLTLHYLRLFETPLWYYELRSLPGTEMSGGLIGLSAGLAFDRFRAYGRLSRPLLMAGVMLIAALLVASIPFLKNLMRPLSADSLKNRKRGIVSLQTSGATCGPASLATLLARYGENLSEREIARAAFTSASGTEAWYLMRFARSRGYRVLLSRPKKLQHVRGPAIVGVTLPGGIGHFIVLLSSKDDFIHFADPSFGETRMSIHEFAKNYRFENFAIRIKPRDQNSSRNAK